MRKILITMFSIMMLIGFTTNNISAQEDIGRLAIVDIDGQNKELETVNVNIDNKQLQTEIPSVNYQGNTIVPVRFIAEQLGAEVKWNENTNTATIEAQNKTIILKQDSSKAIVNGKEENIPNNASVKMMSTSTSGGIRTMIPLRYIAEKLGADVDWVADTNTAKITSNKNSVVSKDPVKPQPEPEPEKPKLNQILSVTAKEENGNPQIHIEADKQINYKNISSSIGGKTIEFKIENATVEKDINISNQLIESINVTKIDNEDAVNVLVKLKKDVGYDIKVENNILKINFTNKILGIEKQIIDGKEAIVIKTSYAPKINDFSLSNPNRVVIDLRNTDLNNVKSQLTTDIIKGLRLNQYSGKEYDSQEKVSRVVLDIDDNYENHNYKAEISGDNIIINTVANKKAPVVVVPPVTPPVIPSSGQRVIVVDAGHGGRDSGAVQNGVREKDVALSVALKTRDRLEALGYKVLMTRTTDVYPSLAERYRLANNSKADAFISIHFNSAGTPAATGIETLYSNKNSQNKAFAQSIQNELIKDTGARNRGLKPRNDLAVLNGTTGISVLPELGFLSNPHDVKELKTDAYHGKVANSLANGVHNYFTR